MGMTKEIKKTILLISCAVAIGFFAIGFTVSSLVGTLSKTGIGVENNLNNNNEGTNITNPTREQDNPANQTGADTSISRPELPKEYSSQTAIDNGDYVNLHGNIHNDSAMTDFLDKVAAKESAFVRTVTYTVEGDPIIIDFSYNSKYFTVTKDTTRDKHGKGEITNRRFDNLVIYEDIDPDRYGDGKRTYYIVTDLSEITAETFMGIDGEVLKYD